MLGAMSGLESDTARTATALAESAPLQALDAEITATRARLQSLAGFADASKAHAETTAAASANAALADQRRALSADLAAARATLSNCNPTHKTKCVRPAEAEIARLSSLLSDAWSSVGSDYAARHDEYQGVQQHLTALENRRAEMLTGDSTAAAGVAVGSADRMLSWLTGLSEERARAMKWLLLVAVFDVLSGLIRLFSEMTHGADIAGDVARRVRALIDSGFSPDTALAMLAGHMLGQPTARRFAEPEQEAQARPFGFAPPEPAPATAGQGRQGAQNTTTPADKFVTPLRVTGKLTDTDLQTEGR